MSSLEPAQVHHGATTRRGARVWALVLVAVVAVAAAGAAGVLPGPAVWLVASAPFVFLLVRRATVRRLAVRNVARRPQEAVLVLIGALLGTAMITGGLLIQNSLSDSLTSRAATQLGPVDEIVTTPDARSMTQVVSVLNAQPPRGVAGVLALVTVEGSAYTTGARTYAQPHANLVEVDFANAQRFGGNPAATGIRGRTPSPGHVALNQAAADALHVRAGDEVTVAAYRQARAFRVDQVLPQQGIASFGRSTSPPPANVFLPRGALESMRSVAPTNATATPPRGIVAVHNASRAADASSRVTAELTSVVAGRPAVVTPIRAQLVAASTTTANSVTGTVSIATVMCVLAGILLLVNTFVMLAQERRVASGMLRAIGMRRAGLVSVFAVEGWLYSIVAAALGVALGVGVAWMALALMSGTLNARAGATDTAIHLSTHASTLNTAFTVGLLVSLAAIMATAVWASRVNIIRATRDLPDSNTWTATGAFRRAAVVVAVLGFAVTIAGALGSQALALLVGPALLAAGLQPVLSRRFPRVWTATVLAGAVILWSIEASTVVPAAFLNATTTDYVVQAVVLAGAAVALFGMHQAGLAALLGRGRRHPRLAVRLGLAYPLARKSRTAMILGIYVLEVMMLALALGISGVSSAQVDHTTALLASGASLQVRSDPASPISPTAIAALPGVVTVTPLQTTTADVALSSGGPTLRSAPLAGSTRNISGHGAPQLSKRDAAYPSDAAVYRALSSHADLIVVDVNFLGDVQSLGGPLGVGAHVALRNPTTGATRVVKIAGVQADVPDGAQVHEYVNPAVITAVAGAPASENLLFVDTQAGTDAHQLAASINARFASSGADALAFRDEANQILGTRGQYFNFLGVLVTVGILIGVFALGVVMIRSVRERRHEIGTIRAIGWTRQSVRRIFLAEAGFLATQGTVIGLCLGTVLAYRISAGTSVTQFVIPWVPLAIVGVLTIGASLLAAVRPAAVAAHIPPAVALRSPE